MKNDEWLTIDMDEWELTRTENNNLIFKRRNFPKWISGILGTINHRS